MVEKTEGTPGQMVERTEGTPGQMVERTGDTRTDGRENRRHQDR